MDMWVPLKEKEKKRRRQNKKQKKGNGNNDGRKSVRIREERNFKFFFSPVRFFLRFTKI